MKQVAFMSVDISSSLYFRSKIQRHEAVSSGGTITGGISSGGGGSLQVRWEQRGVIRT